MPDDAVYLTVNDRYIYNNVMNYGETKTTSKIDKNLSDVYNKVETVGNEVKKINTSVPPVITFVSGEREIIKNFFVDFLPSSANVTNIKFKRVLKNHVIGGVSYTQIVLDFKLGENVVSNYVISPSINSGYALINDAYVKLYVNWDSLTGSSYDFEATVNDYYLVKHNGVVEGLINEGNEDDIKVSYEQFFVKDCKLRALVNHVYNNAGAKYFKVVMQSKIKKVRCKFEQHSLQGRLMLITTHNNTPKNISNITTSSDHFGIYRDAFYFERMRNMLSPVNHSIVFSFALVEGQTYTCGYDYLGNDQIKAYLPDGTTQIFALEGCDENNGNVFILEYYSAQLNGVGEKDLWTPVALGVYVEGEDGDVYKDNFLREDGILTTAPTGQVYTLFRNLAVDDELYSSTNP